VLAAWLVWPLHWETQLLLAVMLLGVMANGGAQIAFSLLQATGHARATALLHVVELPLYVAALVWTVPRYGLMGAAWVWTLRTVVDAAIMIWLARSVLPQSVSVRAAAGWLAAVASMAMFLYPLDMGWAELMIFPLVVISFMLNLVPWHVLRRRYVR
jgi:O-antigen/teichoic acid export membrane protein